MGFLGEMDTRFLDFGGVISAGIVVFGSAFSDRDAMVVLVVGGTYDTDKKLILKYETVDNMLLTCAIC